MYSQTPEPRRLSSSSQTRPSRTRELGREVAGHDERGRAEAEQMGGIDRARRAAVELAAHRRRLLEYLAEANSCGATALPTKHARTRELGGEISGGHERRRAGAEDTRLIQQVGGQSGGVDAVGKDGGEADPSDAMLLRIDPCERLDPLPERLARFGDPVEAAHTTDFRLAAPAGENFPVGPIERSTRPRSAGVTTQGEQN